MAIDGEIGTLTLSRSWPPAVVITDEALDAPASVVRLRVEEPGFLNGDHVLLTAPLGLPLDVLGTGYANCPDAHSFWGDAAASGPASLHRVGNDAPFLRADATGTFWDTVVVCAMTGLVIVSSGLWKKGLAADGTMQLKVDGSPVLDSAVLVHEAFHAVGAWGPWILTIGLLTFVFSTILGWCYYGEKATEYLFGTRAVKPYRILWVLAVLLGSTAKAQAVWDFSDAANGLMAVPNLIALILLSGVIARETKDHAHELSGKD
jgi:hypothetical protein